MTNREAIKIINQYDMNFHWNDGEPIPAEQLAEAFDLSISALKQQEKGGWIPVEESLPEMHDAGILKKLGIKQRSEEVIITVTEEGTNESLVDSGAHLKDGEWDSDTLRWLRAGQKNVKVTAWMPLPEPFKVEK